MNTYEYRGFDKSGQSSRGLIEALTVKNAREKLAAGGVLAEKVSLSGSVSKFKVSQRSVTYRQLSALLGAGIPLEKALQLLVESPEMRNVQVILAGVRDRVREGSSLAAAFTSMCDSVTSFEGAIIEAAEKSATVDVMLERLADFIDEQEKLKAGVLSALLYPSIVVCLALMVAVAVLGFLVPWYRDKLLEFNLPLPAIIKHMAATGTFLSYSIVPAIVAIGLLVWYLKGKFRNDEDFRVKVDRKIYGWPMLGRGYRMLGNLRFARTMSILLGGGVSLIDGLVLSGRATGSAWIARLSAKEAESVRHGSSLSDAVRNIPPLADSLAGWVQMGEASGELGPLMEKAGLKYQDEWNRYTSRCLTILEPALILFVAVLVLLLILPVLMSVINLSDMVEM